MIHMPYYSPCDYEELLEYVRIKSMCIAPSCITCGAMPFRKLCRERIGFENICGIVRTVTPEYFAEHYSFRWMQAATILDCEFKREGGLPRDNYLLQELDRLSEAHENRRRVAKGNPFSTKMTRLGLQRAYFCAINGKTDKEIQKIKEYYFEVLPIIQKREVRLVEEGRYIL